MLEEIKKIITEELENQVSGDEIDDFIAELNSEVLIPESMISKLKLLWKKFLLEVDLDAWEEKYKNISLDIKDYVYIFSPQVIKDPLNIIRFLCKKFSNFLRLQDKELEDINTFNKILHEEIIALCKEIERKAALGEATDYEWTQVQQKKKEVDWFNENEAIYSFASSFEVEKLLEDIKSYESYENLDFNIQSEISLYFLPMLHSLNLILDTHKELQSYKEEFNILIKIIKNSIESLLPNKNNFDKYGDLYLFISFINRMEVNFDNTILNIDISKNSPHHASTVLSIRKLISQVNINFLNGINHINDFNKARNGGIAKGKKHQEELMAEHKKLFEMWKTGQWSSKAACARAYNNALIDSGFYESDDQGDKGFRRLYEGLTKYCNKKNN